jgi:hypothetical protein
VRIWETSGGRERPSIDAPLALISSSIPRIVSSLSPARSRKKRPVRQVWNLAEARELGRLPTDGRQIFALSPRGQSP